ncbi:DUF3455 domain-containing protein [Bradyrhizobium sp.]|uniref:DUF3455 domain-containing protein n=1 Tax=Bradyrhizobium sp. TaxID=376 RepID=UPI001D5F6586|nr:DUF3455 domain-containing protein [Bradyrhizobium sp.]
MFSNHSAPAASRRRPFWATRRPRTAVTVIAAAATFTAAALAAAELPESISAPGETLIVTIHAEGAQVYECKDTAGQLAWQFREPIATLLIDGKTVGRHFAGPSWELDDGSAVAGKVVGRAAGASKADIPLLKLAASPQRDRGMLAGATTIQRLNTRGGTADGPCESMGAMLSVPYAADYAFYRKARATGIAGALRLADATDNRASAPGTAANTKPGVPSNVKTANENKAPLGNKVDEPCTSRHCTPHDHHHQH